MQIVLDTKSLYDHLHYFSSKIYGQIESTVLPAPPTHAVPLQILLSQDHFVKRSCLCLQPPNHPKEDFPALSTVFSELTSYLYPVLSARESFWLGELLHPQLQPS